MLQKIYKLNTLLLLSSLFLIGLSACKKPTSDEKAQQLVLGPWKHEFGTVEFQAGGKLIAKVASGKKLHGGGNPEQQYTANYKVTKDNITITREQKEKDKKAQLQGSDVIFENSELTIVLEIVKLNKKEAVVRYKGKEYTFSRA